MMKFEPASVGQVDKAIEKAIAAAEASKEVVDLTIRGVTVKVYPTHMETVYNIWWQLSETTKADRIPA